jgi:hypothetical protein
MQTLKGMTSVEFKPTHEFHLFDDSFIYVMAELRGDWIAVEAEGTSWYTVCGDTHPEWVCSARGVNRVRKVIKYGHRFRVISKGKSYRYECECTKIGRWVRSASRAELTAGFHARDAVLVPAMDGSAETLI